MAGGAVVVLTQNRYMRRFQDAGATSPESVVTLTEIGCRDHWIFRRLVRKGVFIDCGDGRFYIEPDTAQRFLQRRQRIAIGFIALALSVWALWALLS